MNLVAVSWRSFRRSLRAGELTLLALALIVAVAAVSAVGLFTDRVRESMRERAGEALAADLVISSAEALPRSYAELARADGLDIATITSFPSVVLAGEHSALADVRAVSAHYPLRGQVRLSAVAYGPTRPAGGIPASGTAWLEPRLLAALDVKVGDEISVGASQLRVTAILDHAPDQALGFRSMASSLVLNQHDLAATRLVGPASRVHHRLLMAGTRSAVNKVRATLAPRLTNGQEIESVEDTRPQTRNALDRAGSFLSLAALVSVLVAGAALAMAAQRHALRRTDTVAILRSLGQSRRRVGLLLALELLWVTLAAIALGLAIGWLAQLGLVRLLSGLLPAGLPPPSPWPVITAAGTGFGVVLGFALPPILRVRETPPARVLRHELAPPPLRASLLMALALSSWLTLLVWQTRDPRLASWVFGGTLGTLLLLGAGAGLLLRLLAPLRSRVGVAWRYGLASVLRRGRQSVAQTVAFGLGVMVLLLLTLVRGQLIESWRASLPTDAPNQFLINIQPDDRAGVERFFTAHGLEAPRLYPMVRGRLIAIDGKTVDADALPEGRARHMANREANLSWENDLQKGNHIVAGHWWQQGPGPAVSVERRWAQTLGIKLGDRLTFRVAGEQITAPVTSLRTVDWGSFRPNFFLVFRPGSLDGFPATYITAVHLPREKAPLMLDLVREIPSITPIDVDALITEVREVMDQATLAVEYVFVFTLAAGLLVLLAAVQASRDERRFEAALLRTLGASRRTVLQGLIAEYSVLGLLAGSLGAVAATTAGWLLAGHVFDLPYRPDFSVLASGILFGTLLVGASGVAATWSVVRQPPNETLRRGA